MAPIEIGCNVMVANNCAFYSYNHGMKSDKPMANQPLETSGGIYVEDNVWLGAGVIILDDVRIGRETIVAAGSVVTKSLPPNSVAAGFPARVVKLRN